LVSCLRVGVVDQLRQQSGPSVKLACARLALKLEQNLAISGDAAKWAVESWAIALGLLDPQAASLIDTVSVTLSPEASPQEEVSDAVTSIKEGVPSEAPLPPQEEEAADGNFPPAVEKAPPVYLSQAPEPHRPLPDWSNPAKQWIVHPDSSGQKPILRDALREARANDCLILMPGTYKESLVIKKDLQIRAHGEPQEIILESSAGPVITLDGACLLLIGVTVKGLGAKDKKAAPAVEVRSGHLTIEDCDLTSESSNILEVKGAKSEVMSRRSHFHDGKASGIVFQEGAIGYVEECHFYQNKLSHLVIGQGCSPTVFACKISNALMAGIYVNEGGNGLIENCDIWDNAVAAVQCRRGGNPRVRYCRISGSERYGVLVAEQGEGLFEECQIFDNRKAGVTIGQQSRPRFSNCQISDNREEGVEI